MNEPSNIPMYDSTPPVSEPFYQIWIKALTKPNEQTFAEIAASPNAKMTTALLWVALGSLVSFFLSSLVQNATMSGLMAQYGLPAQTSGGIVSTLITAVCGAPIVAIITAIFFAIGIYIFQWIAKMFGGKGTPDQLAYAMAAITAPVSIVSGVLGLLGAIPYIGFCFGLIILLIGIYVLVLEVMAIKGVNQISLGAAIGTLFIPVLVVFIFCCCLVGVLYLVLGPVIGNVFSSINQSLGGY
jgi:hypothetical protein